MKATRPLSVVSNIGDNPVRSMGWFPKSPRVFYFDRGELFILNERLELEHRIKGFERNFDISSIAVSPGQEILAMSLGNRVRIMHFDFEGMRARFCAALAPYLQSSEDFDRNIGLTPDDRNLCR